MVPFVFELTDTKMHEMSFRHSADATVTEPKRSAMHPLGNFDWLVVEIGDDEFCEKNVEAVVIDPSSLAPAT